MLSSGCLAGLRWLPLMSNWMNHKIMQEPSPRANKLVRFLPFFFYSPTPRSISVCHLSTCFWSFIIDQWTRMLMRLWISANIIEVMWSIIDMDIHYGCHNTYPHSHQSGKMVWPLVSRFQICLASTSIILECFIDKTVFLLQWISQRFHSNILLRLVLINV